MSKKHIEIDCSIFNVEPTVSERVLNSETQTESLRFERLRRLASRQPNVRKVREQCLTGRTLRSPLAFALPPLPLYGLTPNPKPTPTLTLTL